MTADVNYPRRKVLLAMAASAGLSGCKAPMGLDYGTLKDIAEISVGLKDPPGITLEQAAGVPYASIGFRIGRSSEGMLILAGQTGSDLLWTSAEHIAIVTHNGRIVRTGGLRWNLAETQFATSDPLDTNLGRNSPSEGSFQRLVDLRDVHKFAIEITSRFTLVGKQKIDVLGTELETVAYTETCVADQLDWTFQNSFWIDTDSGLVWRSKQYVHPNLDPITIETLRPPA